MTNQKRKIDQMTRWVQRYWIGGVVLLLALLLVKVTPAWAVPNLVPVNQTVPDPTATPENTPVPAATNTPNDDDDDDNPPEPTWTPTQSGGGDQPAPTATAPAAGETPVSPPPADGSITGVVIADALNVRAGPGTNFDKLGTVVRDQTVAVLARNETGDWWLICCVTNTEIQGWVSASYLQPNFDVTQLTTLVPLAQDGSTPRADCCARHYRDSDNHHVRTSGRPAGYANCCANRDVRITRYARSSHATGARICGPRSALGDPIYNHQHRHCRRRYCRTAR